MEAQFLNNFAQLLNLTPEQRQRLQVIFESMEVDPERGSIPPAKADLRVHLRPSSALRQGAALKRAPGAAARPFAPLLDRLSPRLRAKLQEIEPRVLAWVGAREERARAFADDPLAALQQAVPDLEPDVLAEIRSIRSAQQRAATSLRGLEITNVTIDTRPARG